MLQAHKPECNVFQLHVSWYHILALGKIREVMLVAEQLWSWVVKESQEYIKIIFWAKEHWFHWDSALGALFGFIDILVGSSVSLYSAYVELYLLPVWFIYSWARDSEEGKNKMRELWCWNIMMHKASSYNYYKKYL